MLKKLFGGKDNFYISLDNKQAPTSPSPADSPPVQPESSQPVVAATATEEAKVAVAPDKASAKKSKKTSIKKQKVAKAEEETSGASVVVAPPRPKTPLDPKQIAFASAEPVIQNVARRTAGPSLNPFKEMARQMKTPAK